MSRSIVSTTLVGGLANVGASSPQANLEYEFVLTTFVSSQKFVQMEDACSICLSSEKNNVKTTLLLSGAAGEIALHSAAVDKES